MLFRADFTVTGLRLIPVGTAGAPNYPLVFNYGALTVELAPPANPGYARDTGLGTVRLERTPPRRVGPLFEALARGEFPEGSSPERGSDYFDATTERPAPNAVLPLQIMPPAFVAFAQEIRKELWSFASRTIRTLRWRLDHEGPHDPFASRGEFWSLDGTEWERMPNDPSLSMQQLWGLAPTDEALQDVVETVAASGDEPVSHQLFREALVQRNQNPRSALVIGVSAVEVAVKECIAALDPLATWLVQQLPTPPVERLLREYLPTLPAANTIGGAVLAPPADLLDELKKATQWRNRLAHGGRLEVTPDRVAAFLEGAAHDIIWLLTYYAGARWALDYVTNTTRVALGLPPTNVVRLGPVTASVIRRELL